ncbi:hypothetical protein [Hypericibacter adhaerens]|nr:hypothetical protein [Hypericibacter adhaerens]
MPNETETAPAKLPVFRTIEDAFRALRPGWRRLILLILVILAIEIALDLLGAAGAPGPAPDAETAATPGMGIVLLRLVRLLVELLLSVNLLLLVARLVLFAEIPPLGGLFRWGPRQWRLLGLLLLIALVAGMPAIVGGFLSPFLGAFLASPEAVIAFLALYGLCWVWAAGWLASIVPIVASDGPAGVLDRAWRVAEGNRFRLMGIPLCILFGCMIAVGSAEIVTAFFNTELLPFRIPGAVFTTLLLEIVYVAYAAIGAAAYRRMTGAAPEQV